MTVSKNNMWASHGLDRFCVRPYFKLGPELQVTTTPSRQVELVRMCPFMQPTVTSTAKPSTSKGAFKPSSHTYLYQRYTPKVSWTHTFICLADKDEKSVPSREEKRILKEAGLGEKKLFSLIKMVHTIMSKVC